jgi:two-component system OmpR family sensor kinase
VQSHKSLLANASHELRSPLARIRMGLELMDPERLAAHPRRDHAQHRRARPADRRDPAGQPARRRASDIGTVETVDLTGLAAEECARADAELDAAEAPRRWWCRAWPSCCGARSATCWRTRAATATGR